MRTRNVAAFVLSLSAASLCAAEPPAPVAEDHVLVTMSPGVEPPAGLLEPVFPGFANPAMAHRLGLDRMYVARISPMLADSLLRVIPGIERVEADGIGSVADTSDPMFPQQWHLRNTGSNGPPGGVAGADVNYLAAIARVPSAATVILGIIDTGFDYTHPDLAGTALPGWSVLTNSSTVYEGNCPHGTLTAGVAGALTNNLIGVAGAAPGVRLLPVQVLSSCSGTEENCALGIVWAADHGAKVMSLSLQYYTGTTVLAQATAYAIGSDVVMVAAAGNLGPMVAYPARLPGVLAVSATTNRDAVASFSNTGPEISVSAPGEEVLSTFYSGLYVTRSGTSLSSPLVAAEACLIRAAYPELSVARVVAAVQQGVVDLGPAGRDPGFGFGRIDMARALDAACYANCDGSAAVPLLNVADFSCFLQRFAAGEAYANCDESTTPPTLNVADFSCFLSAYASGCR